MRNPALLFSSVRNIISMLSHLKSTLIIGSKTGKKKKKKNRTKMLLETLSCDVFHI